MPTPMVVFDEPDADGSRRVWWRCDDGFIRCVGRLMQPLTGWDEEPKEQTHEHADNHHQ